MDSALRYAIVSGTDIDRVANYLPSNYSAYSTGHDVVIVGEDSAGWTLDGYVIPRLASGMICARELGARTAAEVMSAVPRR